MKAKALVFLFGLAALSASASSVYDFSSAPTTTDPTKLSFGFQFSTNANISVASLGYFDGTGNGFASAHKVGIFDDSGTLLVSAMLDAGASEPLNGQFRFRSIAPVTLAAGQNYVLAATSGGSADSFAYGDANTTLANFTVDSRISIADDSSRFLYQSDDVLRDPTNHFAYTLYAGPSFEIAATATPEPGSGALVGAAGVLCALVGFSVHRSNAERRNQI